MADRKPLPTTSTYSSAFDLESTSDSVNTGSRPLLPSTEEFHICEPQPSRSKAKALSQSAQRLAAESWHDAKKDCKSARWRRGGLWTLLILWGVGLVLALALLPLHAAASSHLACKPDHSFSVLNRYNAWNLGGFFPINVAPFCGPYFLPGQAHRRYLGCRKSTARASPCHLSNLHVDVA